MSIGLPVKYPLYLSDFNDTWIFLDRTSKILKYQILWKFVRWEQNCSMRVGRQAHHVATIALCGRWELPVLRYALKTRLLPIFYVQVAVFSFFEMPLKKFSGLSKAYFMILWCPWRALSMKIIVVVGNRKWIPLKFQSSR
jgi:hypothetical protein